MGQGQGGGKQLEEETVLPLFFPLPKRRKQSFLQTPLSLKSHHSELPLVCFALSTIHREGFQTQQRVDVAPRADAHVAEHTGDGPRDCFSRPPRGEFSCLPSTFEFYLLFYPLEIGYEQSSPVAQTHNPHSTSHTRGACAPELSVCVCLQPPPSPAPPWAFSPVRQMRGSCHLLA